MDRKSELTLPKETPWLNDPDAKRVCEAIQSGGFDIFFVGGCVRNAILGEPVSDIDLSTNAKPQVVMQLAQKAGLKSIPTGIDHGTVTVVSSGIGFEITTYRRDVETDGRRAVVAFSDRIEDDARRRDFTMNALYARPDGVIVDPLNGLQDALARRIRFIEDAEMRIREDYLRVLRYFRFSAWYGDEKQGFDPDALHAIARHLDGLSGLSAERVGSEMIKLLLAPNPAMAVAVMRQTGVLNTILSNVDDTWLAPLIHVEQLLGLDVQPMRRLAVLGGQAVEDTLRLSKAQSRQLKLFHDGIGSGVSEAELAYRFGAENAKSILALRCAYSACQPSESLIARIEQGGNAEFPVKAVDLMEKYTGPALGAKLKELEADWIASQFCKTKSQLLGGL